MSPQSAIRLAPEAFAPAPDVDALRLECLSVLDDSGGPAAAALGEGAADGTPVSVAAARVSLALTVGALKSRHRGSCCRWPPSDFLGVTKDAFCASVARHVSEFEEASGHRVDVQLIANDEYFANKLAPYLGGESPADVYMSGPVLIGNSSRRICRATGPVSRTSRLRIRPRRLPCHTRAVNRWNGSFGEPLGEGPLLELPVNCESYNLAYLPAVLERVGAEVPSTWDDYFAVARQIAERAAPCRGFGQRGAETCGTPSTRDSQASCGPMEGAISTRPARA